MFVKDFDLHIILYCEYRFYRQRDRGADHIQAS